jgi:aryl-alcohol dehydrogenase-like predicted oxidoreductase
MATLETDSQPPFHKYLWNGMKYVKLGTSDLMVSEVCLGTMTWGGAQNTDEDAREQLDVAFNDYGVNFIDTAEIYPVPPSKETQGNTDRAIAKWLKGRDRSDVVLASKVHDENGFDEAICRCRFAKQSEHLAGFWLECPEWVLEGQWEGISRAAR